MNDTHKKTSKFLSLVLRHEPHLIGITLDEAGWVDVDQGHSVPVELGYEPADPPEVLLHGTAEKAVEGIRREGIHKGQRHHVHLSERAETAGAVGMRHGKLVVFEVAAGRMRRDGFAFFRTPNGVWLVDHVPPEYLRKMQNDE